MARTLNSSPNVLPLYARAAAPMLPGASLLPFVPGGGGEIPEHLDLELLGVRADPAAVAAYCEVCGFTLRDELPPTYPHLLAFPLQMAVMADGSFPFGAVGLVHVENQIVQQRPIAIGEELTIRVRPTPLRPHPKGHTFSLQTVVLAGEEPVWSSTSTMLHRGKPNGGEQPPAEFPKSRAEHDKKGTQPAMGALGVPAEAPASAVWRLGGDLGRRYAGVSGDRNPIHLHSLTAKPLGFPAAIAHGMWTKARALAALEGRIPDSFEVDVRFRRPVVLPARVEFASQGEGEETGFAVRAAGKGTPHLDGRVRPLAGKEKPKSATSGRKKAK